MHPRDNQLNTPAEMLVRFVFLARYLCFFAGLFMVGSTLHQDSPRDALMAGLFFAAMAMGHRWLKQGDKGAECGRALDAMFTDEKSPDDEAGLEALLHRREVLEEKRGTPGFDPWEVQAVRREISDYMRAHPESTARFDDGR